jgi:hypothetical protein
VLAVDHVLIVVHDLDDAAERLYERTGLASAAGGRHAGHGTGNRIVPLGNSYLELMTVVDRAEAAASPAGSWLEQRLVQFGEGPAGLCLRTDDLEAVAQRTGHPSLPMSRTRPDGVRLDWHLVGREAAFSAGLPFFIEWHIDDADHPGRTVVEHRRAPTGIEWVELGGDEERLASWLGPHEDELPLRHVDGRPGPHRVAITMTEGATIMLGSEVPSSRFRADARAKS